MMPRCSILLSAAVLTLSAAAASGAITATPAPNQLYGHITSNRTLTASSPGPVYEIIGDLIVDPGVTLTLERGVTVEATSYSDFLASGSDRGRVEIIVQGTLLVPPGSDPVVMSCTAIGPDAWYGIVVAPGGSVSLNSTTVQYGICGIRAGSGGVVHLDGCTLNNDETGVSVDALGTVTLSGGSVSSATTGAFISADGTLLASHCALTGVTNGLLYEPGAHGDVSACVLTGIGSDSGEGISLPFAPSLADSITPQPTIVSQFLFGLHLTSSGLRLDHFVVSGCRYAVHDDFGSQTVTYCTFVGDSWDILGSGTGDAVYNSILLGLLSGENTFYQTTHINYSDVWGFVQFGVDPWAAAVSGDAVSSFDPFFVSGDLTYHLDVASLFTNFSVSGGQIGAYGPGPIVPTPVAGASLVSAEAADGVARIRWFVGAAGRKASVLRRVDGSDWKPRAVLFGDGTGYVSFEDRDVEPGTRYEYGIGTQNGGSIAVDGDVWLTIQPRVTSIALLSITPNPSPSGWNVGFVVPTDAVGQIDVLDVAGRRLTTLNLGNVTIGAHSTHVSANSLAPGTYWIRLRQGGHTAMARAVMSR